MTMKEGFVAGLFFGFVAFLFLNGSVEFAPAPIPARNLIGFLAVLIFPLLSFGIGIGSILEGHSIFGTTEDGFIYGFTTALDVPYILNLIVQFLQGNLPFPWQT